MAELTITPDAQGDTQAHIDAMVAKANGATPAPAAAPAEPAPATPERPAWLPEKFATAEDMAKAYAALEGKLGGKPDAAPAETPAVTAEETQKTAEAAVEAAGLDMASLETKIATNGALDDTDYAALEKAGISRQMADSYIEGQKALGERMVERMHDTVGGEDSFNNIIGWAADNLSPAEINAFNSVVDTGSESAVQLALQGLQAKFNAAGNNAPNLLAGGKTSSSGDVFRSVSELTRAMSDPRYSRDPAYRADVEAKLGRSSII